MNAKEKAAAKAAAKEKAAEEAKKKAEEKEAEGYGNPEETAADSAPTTTPTPVSTSTKETQAEIDAASAEEKGKGQKFAFCRILGGIVVSVKLASGQKNILLRSAAKKSVAGDGSTLKFDLNSTDYGITVLSKEEAAACEKALKTSKLFMKRFVFFADNLSSGEALAKKFYEMHQTTGFEQLNMADIEKAVQKYESE